MLTAKLNSIIQTQFNLDPRRPGTQIQTETRTTSPHFAFLKKSSLNNFTEGDSEYWSLCGENATDRWRKKRNWTRMSAPVPQRITSSGYSLITFFSLMLIVFFLTCFQIYVYSIFPMSRRPWWPFLTSLLVQSELTEEKRPREEARTSLLIYYCLFLFVWFSFNVRPGLHFLVEWVILVSGSSHKFMWV